eukprot:TRINITY_DN51959_c0_g1_i1.p1 TRINITY_DN51959_c0_g1~~TRINITY_DN51959_c0_g1_i1.p1  ORF type:complete len:310 (+),score=101.39 TRINITY_DN51959_c0_g1_i1:161-1090(+)
MGQNCALCGGTGRKPEDQNADGKAPKQPKAKESRPPLEYTPKGQDAQAFDAAYEKDDVAGIAKQLTSEEEVQSLAKKLHPWASNPKTVGSLACLHLARLASLDLSQDSKKAGASSEEAKTTVAWPLCSEVKQQAAEAKATVMPALVACLEAQEMDRRQAGVIALSFLTTESEENGQAAFDAGALPVLLDCMRHSVHTPFQMAAATALRNMCIVNETAAAELRKLDGLKDFVELLTAAPSDVCLRETDLHLEALLNLQDLLESRSGNPVAEAVQLAKTAGAVEKVRRLTSSGDADVKDVANDVLTLLQKH